MANDDFKKIAEDATTFPILTEGVSFPADTGRSGLTAGTAPLSQKVDMTLREILGWRPRNNDPRGFVASLTQSFEIKEVEGHNEWMWRPRTYAAEADLGAITGAQASLYSRARAALSQALPLLDGLTPLRADHDQEDIEAARAIVHSGLTELVYELGIEGGPRLARVDGYFFDLLGPIADPNGTAVLTDPENVGGQLASLRDVFGLVGIQVNTVDEEQNLTNFFILVDTINSLWLTWRSQRDAFDHSATGRSFLGTQLVLLSRNLSVVAESVDEAYFAMNSVFLGPAERQTTRLVLASGEVVFVGELLDWVRRFAAEEGPRLLREGGKEGVIRAFRPTIDRLTTLVTGAFDVSKGSSSNPTRGFHTARVQRALEEVKINLEATQENAKKISRLPAPEINLVEDDPVTNGDPKLVEVLLTISGNNFQNGADLTLSIPGHDLKPARIIFVTPAMIRVIFDLTNKIPASSTVIKATINLTNPDGKEDEAEVFITIPNPAPKLPPPSIATVTHVPVSVTEAAKLADLQVTIAGSGFQPGATVMLKIQNNDVSPKSLNVTSPTEIKASFDLTGKFTATPGHDIEGQIVVTNHPDGQQTETVPGKGVIIKDTTPITTQPAPTITNVQPNPVLITKQSELKAVDLTITGTNFQGVKVSLDVGGTAVPSKPISGSPTTSIKAEFDLRSVIHPMVTVDAKVIVINLVGQQAEAKVTIKSTIPK